MKVYHCKYGTVYEYNGSYYPFLGHDSMTDIKHTVATIKCRPDFYKSRLTLEELQKVVTDKVDCSNLTLVYED